MKKTWRCYFCDVVLRSPASAREHFGASQLAEPACQLKGHEHGLIGIVRKQEAELARFRAEDSDLIRAWHSRDAEHQAEVRRAEELGYDRGLRDGRTYPAEHPA